jgi:hypothetical protein
MASRKVSNQFAGGALKSLAVGISTASTAIAGTAFDLGAGYSAFSVQVTGLIAASKVVLQGSLDGTNWTNLGSTAGYASTAAPVVEVSAPPVQHVRLYGVTVTTGAARAVVGYIGVA